MSKNIPPKKLNIFLFFLEETTSPLLTNIKPMAPINLNISIDAHS